MCRNGIGLRRGAAGRRNGRMEMWQIILACGITLFAGLVKGAIGFAMPMIMLSSFASFLRPDLALALLILPTLATNLFQAFRQGLGAAGASIRRFGWHIAMVCAFIPVAAPFVPRIPQAVMYGALGLPILAFAALQLRGGLPKLPIHRNRRAQVISGVIGGLYGGISGIWGPPLIVLLLSLEVPKQETVRVQGVVFLLGAVILTLAHLGSGVLNAQTLPLSALMVVPGMLGMMLGARVQDRLEGAQFRRWTLILLALSGLNLVRRAFLG